MTDPISCPRCKKPVDSNARVCEHCGVDLALAALLAERALTVRSQDITNVLISPEVLVPRLGDYLIEKGVLKLEGLDRALDYQKQSGDAGQPRLIGQALLELGLVSQEVLNQAVTEQILQLQSALQQANTELESRVRERTLELENALNRLAELNQLKSNFIANISHELRTPLTHLKGYIELLVDDGLGPLTPGQLNALTVMHKSEERLEKLIEDLIQFSMANQGDLHLDFSHVDLHDVLDGVIMLFLQKCKEAGLSLQTEIPKNLPFVKADEQKIVWVISQLMDNAVKFTPEGGRVQIGVRVEKMRVTLYVYDTGIGISQQKLKDVFEPFHQLDGSATRRYGGTGLGLAMAQQIVESHGSNIKVKSKEGAGAYFEFSLSIVNE